MPYLNRKRDLVTDHFPPWERQARHALGIRCCFVSIPNQVAVASVSAFLSFLLLVLLCRLQVVIGEKLDACRGENFLEDQAGGSANGCVFRDGDCTDFQVV